MQMEYTQGYSGEMECFLNKMATSSAVQPHLACCQQTSPAQTSRYSQLLVEIHTLINISYRFNHINTLTLIRISRQY